MNKFFPVRLYAGGEVKMDFGVSSDKAPNLEELMQLGIRTAKDGNLDNARVIFQKVLDADKRNERAWLWMAHVAENNIKRRQYLETVLRLNPNNISAHKYLDSMDAVVDKVEGNSITLGLMVIIAMIVIMALIVGIVIVSSGQASGGLGFIILIVGGLVVGVLTIALVLFLLARRS
jgi:hypothetical protein